MKTKKLKFVHDMLGVGSSIGLTSLILFAYMKHGVHLGASMIEAIFIVVALGLLEVILWLADRKELKEQTQILEDIAVSLSVKETSAEPATPQSTPPKE